jgi:hypothetical protein
VEEVVLARWHVRYFVRGRHVFVGEAACGRYNVRKRTEVQVMEYQDGVHRKTACFECTW